MKRTFAGLLVVVVGSLGCNNKDRAGGPGATNPAEKPPLVGQADNTFNLSAPTTSLKQGESKVVLIGIKRGTNFQEDVTLKFSDLPKGVSFEPSNATIKHTETEGKVTLMVAADAALGDFTIKLTGHPTKGSDGSTELKISIAKDTEPTAKVKRDEYVREMNTQLAVLDTKFTALKASASKAEGAVAKDLEKKIEAMKIKRDTVATLLDEMKEAAPDRWEKIKDSLGSAYEELKKMFN